MQAKLQINHGEKDKKKSSKKNSRDATTSSKGEKRRDFPTCKHCGKKGHPPFKCCKRPDVKCGKCNKLGHDERKCKSNFQQKDDAQVVSEQEEEQMFVASCFTSRSSSSSYCWLLDSGCTNHMTGDEELFRELDRSQVSSVRIGNGDCIPVKGKGTVALESCIGTKLIYDVLYVPDIDQNLLSVGQLVDKGFKVIFENKLGIIKDIYDNDVIRIKMRGKSFLLDPMEEEQAAYTATTTNKETRHKRLGHFHHAAILNMQKRKLVHGLSHIESDLPSCKACQFGKQARLPFRKGAWRATEKLQLIHIDVAGPYRTPSLNGSKYYVAFIDDFTRMCWIYFLRSDNGKEYTSSEFDKFCEAGIEHQLTAPYTPQQNEAANKSSRCKTPFEVRYDYKPQIKNLKVFDCLCVTHVPQIKHDKLDKRAEPGIFVGYSLKSNAYRVFQPDTRRILISRDVSFMENDKWSWNNAEIQQPNELNHDELIDDPPIRGTRLLADIYQR
nr:Retrovirus-related Pol polyprotein from transposon TNT 1-94 [Ipomoea batatas]